MKVKIVTTITSWVDLDTMSPEHSVEINAEDADGFPPGAIYAVVIGACNSTVQSIEAGDA